MLDGERDVRGGHFVFFGGSTGIGRAAAHAVGQRGGHILIVGRGREAGEAAAAGIKKAGAASAEFLSADLSTVDGVAAVAADVKAWKPSIHGVMHTAMSGFRGKTLTGDGLEFAFALQYLARALLNRLLLEQLAASGDGRIVHITGNVPEFFMPDLEDLQFERRKFGFYKALLGTHLLGFLHIQEATRRWADMPVTLAAACVGSTKTKVMSSPEMPLTMRLLGVFATSPEASASNAIRLLTAKSAADARGAVLRNPKQYTPQPIALDPNKAAKLWAITDDLTKSVARPSSRAS